MNGIEIIGLFLSVWMIRNLIVLFKAGYRGPFSECLGITEYDYDGTQAQMTWAELTLKENYEENFFFKNKLESEYAENDWDPEDLRSQAPPVAVINNLEKGDKGDHIRFPFLGQLGKTLSTHVFTGNTTLEGNEQEVEQGDLDVYVDQVRSAVGFVGRVSALRAKNLRTSTLHVLLREFAIDWLEDDMFYALMNGASRHLIDVGTYTASAHPNTYYGAGLSTTDPTVLTDDNRLSTEILDFVERRWKSKTGTLPKARYGGRTGIIGLVSPMQMTSLIADPLFQRMHIDALSRARDSDKNMHPMFANANYCYREIYLYEISRVLDGSELASTLIGDHDESHHAAIFLGPRALMCAHAGIPSGGMAPAYGSKTFTEHGNYKFLLDQSSVRDYGNLNKWGLAMVYGYIRSQFTVRSSADDSASSGTTYCNSGAVVWTKEQVDSF